MKIRKLKENYISEAVISIDEQPWDKNRIEKELKSITRNWTVKFGDIKVLYDSEIRDALEVLDMHYNDVTKANYRSDGGWVVISFGEPKSDELTESLDDGWELDGYIINDVLDNIYNLQYEINNTVRGVYSNAYTYSDLANYIRNLATDLNDAADEIDDLGNDINECLYEDTVKTKSGKWVNKGDTGETHGEFRTKKEADAQRRAIFANWKK